VVSSSHPRLVDGVPTKNPRYLQQRPDLVNARGYVSGGGLRAAGPRGAGGPAGLLPGERGAGRAARQSRRPEIGLPPLAVYNPIHYQELPELFMDFVCSLTGKSPSTTGFGSEGALTKGPFNALWPVVDLNNALVSFILTEYAGFTTAAGYGGAAISASITTSACWCRRSGAACAWRSATRNS
jgi:hypothetical protein